MSATKKDLSLLPQGLPHCHQKYREDREPSLDLQSRCLESAQTDNLAPESHGLKMAALASSACLCGALSAWTKGEWCMKCKIPL